MSAICGWSFFGEDAPYSISDAEVMCDTMFLRGGNEKTVLKDKKTIFVCSSKSEEKPFFKDDKTESFIVFDGELYNKRELIYELEHSGYSFLEKSSAEIALKCYLEWGKSSLLRLCGSFALAVYDKERDAIILSRDRFGTKTLFFKRTQKGVAFSSEIKALLSLPDSVASVGSEGLCSILGLGGMNVPPNAVFREIESVKAAHYVFADKKNISHRLYSEITSMEHRENLSNTAEKVRYLVREAISRRLSNSSQDTVIMSGDLGSAVICALGAGQYAFERGERLSTCFFEYRDKKGELSSDRSWISRMCDEFSTRHRIIQTELTDLYSTIEKCVVALDLPVAKIEDLLFFSSAKQLAKKHTFAMTSDASDDLFGSISWLGSNECFNFPSFPWLKGKESVIEYINEDMMFYLNSKAYITKAYKYAVKKTPPLQSENEFESRRRELFYLNNTVRLPHILQNKNIIAENAGLSLCMPFCDGALSEYVWNIPWNIKAPAGCDKGVLRLAMKGIVPDDVLDRTLNNNPVRHTPVLNDKIYELSRDLLCSLSEPIYDFINLKKLSCAIDSRTISPETALTLIEFDIWLKQYGVTVK